MMKIYETLSWYPAIGDPSFMGWLTVAAYFCTAIMAGSLYLTSSQVFAEYVAQQKQFWLFMALILFALGINKQLDLQSLLTAIGKFYAHRDGWYEHRRNIQIIGISTILFFALMGLVIFALKMRTILKTNWLAIVGLTFLLVFVMVRATSFHHMDILINTTILGVRMNWVLELSGIACIGYTALSLIRKSR